MISIPADRIPLVSAESLHDAEDVEEEVDKVEVEIDRGQDVLLRRQLVHDHVRVKDDEAAEEDCASDGEDKLQRLAPEKQLERRRNS